jgi:hypothetical protein
MKHVEEEQYDKQSNCGTHKITAKVELQDKEEFVEKYIKGDE